MIGFFGIRGTDRAGPRWLPVGRRGGLDAGDTQAWRVAPLPALLLLLLLLPTLHKRIAVHSVCCGCLCAHSASTQNHRKSKNKGCKQKRTAQTTSCRPDVVDGALQACKSALRQCGMLQSSSWYTLSSHLRLLRSNLSQRPAYTFKISQINWRRSPHHQQLHYD